MKKWLNDLYAQILKNGYSGGGSGGGGSHSGGAQGVLVGNYLGDTYTDTQKAAISSGTFEGLNIGDYWIINDITWRIADFDYYYNVGDTPFTKHHVIIVPDTVLYNVRMNPTNTTLGAYTGSEMYRTNLNQARTAFDNAFGSTFIPTHRGLYAYDVNSSGSASSSTWRDMRIELMNEVQLYGHSVWKCNGFDIGSQKTQFRLFLLDQTKINTGQSYWLTNVDSGSNFVRLNGNGGVSTAEASSSNGVRPFACVVGD